MLVASWNVARVCAYTAVYLQRRALSRGEGLARPINNHGRSRRCCTAVAAQDLLPLSDLRPALCESDATGVQTLDQGRVSIEESCEPGRNDGHESGLWYGFLHLVEHGRKVVLEVSEAPLAFEDEPFQIGLRFRSQTVQMRLLHGLIVITGAQQRRVWSVHDRSLTAVGITPKPYAVLQAGRDGHTLSAALPQEGLLHS